MCKAKLHLEYTFDIAQHTTLTSHHRAVYLSDQLKQEESGSSMAQVFRLDTPRALVAEYPEAPTPPPESAAPSPSGDVNGEQGVVVGSSKSEGSGSGQAPPS